MILNGWLTELKEEINEEINIVKSELNKFVKIILLIV